MFKSLFNNSISVFTNKIRIMDIQRHISFILMCKIRMDLKFYLCNFQIYNKRNYDKKYYRKLFIFFLNSILSYAIIKVFGHFLKSRRI